MTDINKALLTTAGMASARAELTKRHEWFLHAKPTSRFGEIKVYGLAPRRQDYLLNDDAKTVLSALGQNAEKIICLRPKDTFDTTPRGNELMFLMALHRDALPPTITLDWTYVGNLSLVPVLNHGHLEWTKEQIFCEVVRRRGSVVIYDHISTNALRVWAKGTDKNDPSTWPTIISVDLSVVEQFV
jgi:hypothetical protein